jgi:predicted KAP-like P-loop ATPase
MSPLAPSGYDVARSRREEDDLDRWRFAAEVVEVNLATPADWSARIGIFGKWGSGKSTVLRFAEQMLKESKSIVFWFNPWAVQDWNDLWEVFGNRLSEALSEAGIAVDSTWLKVAKSSTAWLGSKGVSQIARVGAAALGKDKAVDATFALVSRWLKYDGPQIRAIQKKVKGRRLVVLIDDLDRCAPDLLPQLLLSLRELLDLPGFTFVLAFDDEIVARALIDENPAWSDGSSFLEKILDFRFHLPSITEKQKERLVLNAMAKYCPFVPQESAKKIEDLLPNSPRKLKALVVVWQRFDPR